MTANQTPPNTPADPTAADPTAAEHELLDVLIIGAGISGIGAGHYLSTEHPDKSFVILESRPTVGGTWDLFRYPGIRSDSDLYTFGYEFKPWTDKQSIADADRILNYLHEAVDDDALTEKIECNKRVVSIDWSSAEQCWTAVVVHQVTGAAETVRARWIFAGTGYYRYDEGYTPVFPGRERFTGEIVHPQHWPEDLDYTGKKVVVIGSGATAVTLVPSMAERAEHVTMLQRTPTYVVPLPREDPAANLLMKVLGDKRGFKLARTKNIARQRALYEVSQRIPAVVRRVIRWINKTRLPKDFDVDVHFNPPYKPWDQRMCAVPDSDLFASISERKASVVTAQISTFTERGILLETGEELAADIIVTATGLNLQLFGGMDITRDGAVVDLTESIAYRGFMLSQLPNLALSIGYTNSSWTLKVDMLCQYFMRLLSHMDAHGYGAVEAVPDPGMETRPMLDFGAGYVQRAMNRLPKQGTVKPWQMTMNVAADVRQLRHGPVDDRFLQYQRAVAPALV